MAESQARKELINKFKEINKAGDFSAWEEMVLSNEVYGNGYAFHIGSGCKAVFSHEILTQGENKWQIPVDSVIEFCKQQGITLGQFFKTGVILREGNVFKAMLKDSKGSVGTSPAILLLQNPESEKKGDPPSGFSYKNPNDWIGAIGAITAAGSTLVQAMAALKSDKKEDRSIQDIASLISALNTGNNQNEFLFKFFEMQQDQRRQDNQRFEDLINEISQATSRDPFKEMERTEELLDRIQAKAKPTPPPSPPPIGGSDNFWEKGLDVVSKLLDRPAENGHQPAPPEQIQAPPPREMMEERMMEQPEFDDSPEAQLQQGDLQITQNIINKANPLSVVSDIGKLIMWAKEAGVIDLIEEVRESNYVIEDAFTLYIQTRSTDPAYTEELLTTAKTFLPLVQNFKLKDEFQPEPIEDEITTDPDTANPDSDSSLQGQEAIANAV